jgi:hypothetical protein
MTNPMTQDINVETGKSVIREMTADEFAEYNAIISEQAEANKKAAADKAAATAKLEALGLTPDDLKALGL